MLFSSSLGLWDCCTVRLTMLSCGRNFWSLRNPAQVPAPPSPGGPLGASLWDGHPEEPARMSDYFMMTFWSRARHAGRGTKSPLKRGRCQAFMLFVLSKNAQWHVLVGETWHWNLNELWNFKHESSTVSGRPCGCSQSTRRSWKMATQSEPPPKADRQWEQGRSPNPGVEGDKEKLPKWEPRSCVLKSPSIGYVVVKKDGKNLCSNPTAPPGPSHHHFLCKLRQGPQWVSQLPLFPLQPSPWLKPSNDFP